MHVYVCLSMLLALGSSKLLGFACAFVSIMFVCVCVFVCLFRRRPCRRAIEERGGVGGVVYHTSTKGGERVCTCAGWGQFHVWALPCVPLHYDVVICYY